MNTLLVRRPMMALVLGLFTVLSSGCAAPGNGYNTRVGVSVNYDGPYDSYYEPYGSYYGGWGPGYYVGPINGNNYSPHHGGRPTPPAYRPAPLSRPVPSIPSRRRSGNSRLDHRNGN